MSPSGSTRWCPTPEQLMILKEMYRGGVRTPNASQIQKITAHLSFYGKIEGKNVFYWFQNHKARERQKLRRKLIKQLYQQQLLQEQLHLRQYHDRHLHHQNNFLRFSNSESPPPAMHFFDKSVHYLPQSGAEGASTQQMKINSKRKTDSPIANMYKMQPSCMMRSYWDDWRTTMMIRDGGHDNLIPCCSHNKPLKTLQLFPIKTPCSTVKDQPTLN